MFDGCLVFGAWLLICCARNLVAWLTDGAKFACLLLDSLYLFCILSLSACLLRFVALIFCEHVLFEVGLGARSAP